MANIYALFTHIAGPFFIMSTLWLLLKRRVSAWRTFLLLMGCLVLSIGLSLAPSYSRFPAMYIVVSVPFIAVTIYAFEGTFWQKIFATWCVLNASVLICFASSPLAQAFAPFGSGAFYGWLMLFMLVLYSIELFICARFLRGLFPRLFEIKGRMWVLYSAGAWLARQMLRLIVEPDAVIAITMPPPLGEMSLYGYYVVICASIWCFASTGLAISFTFRSMHADYEAKLSREALAAARGHYEALSSIIDEARVLRHDMRHTISTVLEMAKRGGNAEILRFLSQEKDAPEEYIRFCEHGVADALLNWYARRFASENIPFQVCVDIPADVEAEAADLCALLGNLLENAYEACLTAPPAARYARVNAHTDPEMLALTVENSFDGKLNLRSGEILSRKPGGGQGLRSAKAVCEKYGGDFLPSYTRDIFTALALLNLSE
jgi:hypothetical protein